MFGALTGGPLRREHTNAINLINQEYPKNVATLNKYYNTALDRLGWTSAAHANTLQGGMNAATKRMADQMNLAYERLGGQYGQARNDIQGGLDRANELYQSALDSYGDMGNLWDPISNLAGEYGRGREMYFDALGFGGDEGLGRATDAFGSSLRSNFMQDEALDAILRQRNAAGGGQVLGGNVDRDTAQWVSDYAGSQTDSWLNRIAPFVDKELAAENIAAAGRADALGRAAGIYQDQAGLNYGAGMDMANLAYGYGSDLANMHMGHGKWLGDTQMGTSGAIGNAQLGIGTNMANLDYGHGQGLVGLNERRVASITPHMIGRGQAAVQGSANALRLGTSLLGGVLGAFGGPATGGAGLLGSLFGGG